MIELSVGAAIGFLLYWFAYACIKRRRETAYRLAEFDRIVNELFEGDFKIMSGSITATRIQSGAIQDAKGGRTNGM